EEYRTKSELAEAFSRRWDEATDFWRRRDSYDKLRHWLLHDLGEKDVSAELQRIADSTEITNLDSQLFAVLQALDADRTPSFRGMVLTAARLKDLADVSQNDPAPASAILALHRNRVLQIAAQLPAQRDLATIWKAQAESIAEYNKLREKIREQTKGDVAPRELNDDHLVTLLAASVPASLALSRLRERAAKAATSDALESPWFQALGKARHASPAAALLIDSLAERARETGIRRRYDLACQRFGMLVGVFAGSCAGAIAGIVSRVIVNDLISPSSMVTTAWICGCVIAGAVKGGMEGPRWVRNSKHNIDDVKLKAAGYSLLALAFAAVLLWLVL
ncbi:MAG: hypothetical protein WAN65_22275, partial [Candidatus Sulfotelmatobacter sp.]